MPVKILGSRVDGLTLAYRLTLNPAFVEALRESSRLSAKHGRAGFEWFDLMPVGVDGALPIGGGSRTRRGDAAPRFLHSIHGELRFSDRQSCWQITNQPYFRLLVKLHAPGAVEKRNEATGAHEKEGGWTVEVVFYAQWLAEIGLEAAIREGAAIASLCGEVHDTRLRRIDLCSDIQGWSIRESDVRRLVKRPRARWQKEYGDVGVGPNGVEVRLPVEDEKRRVSKVEKHEAIRAQDFGRGALDRRQITGVSVGRGGAMMSRIYDKRAELERDEERRANEERRWRHDAGCPDLALANLRELDELRGECPHCRRWDGQTRVTRIEFQIRGTVIRELGLLDPEAAQEVVFGETVDGRGRTRACIVGHKPLVTPDGEVLGLVDRLDWLWRTCLEWVRIVKLQRREDGKLKPVGRLEEDPRWTFLRGVQFAAARAPSTIKRFRVRAAASASMGLGVALAQAGRDGELEMLPVNSGAYDERTAKEELVERVTRLKRDEALKIVEMLLTKYGGAVGACVHLAVRNNAALLRFKERRSAYADFATGPPDGGGPRPASSARGCGDDAEGSQQAMWAVA